MKDPLLFTPGPLTTSPTVKGAMQRDLGSRDGEFIRLVRRLREKLLALAGLSQAAGYEAILLQGSGTFVVEAVLSSVIPREGRLLILSNGAYGERMRQIAERHGIEHEVERWAEDESPDATRVGELLEARRFTHVAMVHLETTSGLLNPVSEIGRAARAAGCRFILDAMSSFGGVEPFAPGEWEADYVMASPNKCLESVPGFAFVLARRSALEETAGCARTLSLDLLAQWEGLERDGQFRFTPPTHALLALEQALRELEAEGGVPARAARYRANQKSLVAGMEAIGFRTFLPPEKQSGVITSFHYPEETAFDFSEFYRRLAARGFVIYPGKVSRADCFRIGTIGRIATEDIAQLLAAIRSVRDEMGFLPE